MLLDLNTKIKEIVLKVDLAKYLTNESLDITKGVTLNNYNIKKG